MYFCDIIVYMLSKQQRFHTQGAVRRVMQHGKPIRGRHMMVRSIDTRSPVSRVAIVVSKKVYKSAVKRNRTRRRLYNIVRHELEKPSVVKDITITVLSPEILLLDHDSLSHELLVLLQSSVRAGRDNS